MSCVVTEGDVLGVRVWLRTRTKFCIRRSEGVFLPRLLMMRFQSSITTRLSMTICLQGSEAWCSFGRKLRFQRALLII
ncbi:hypothetical protein DWU95_45265 [Burkholderia contaminans]|nr:hypothetical protein DWU95_45265 [Burkholderia contaminans]